MLHFISAAAIDLLPSLILLLPCILLWQMKGHKNTNPARNVLLIILGIYFMGVFHVTGLPAINNFTPQININLIPSIPFQRYPVHYYLNIFMLIPFGLLLPCLWNCFQKFRFTLMAGFCFSLSIELLQLLTFRTTDIDDLITNTLGTIIGYLLAKLCIRLHWISSPEPTASHRSNIREFLILLGMCLFMWSVLLPIMDIILCVFSQ